MIVRILNEGQWTVDEELMDELNRLDADVEAAIEAADEPSFENALAALLHGVRQNGSRVADDSLEDSDLILPPADATIDEVRELLEGEGLIPG